MAAAIRSLLHPPNCLHHQQIRIRHLTKVRLKWVNSRGLDHIIDRDVSIKACVFIKDAILHSPSSLLSIRSLKPLQKPLNLTVPILHFLRPYPTLFSSLPHPCFPSFPSFSLSPASHLLHNQEIKIYDSSLNHSAETLAKLLMMTRSRSLPVASLYPLWYDLGLPDDFIKKGVAGRPDLFETTMRRRDGACCISLATWPEHLAISTLQRRQRDASCAGGGSGFRPVAFPVALPKGYGG